MPISIVQGDITKQQVDAIVNAANERMLGGGGVDGAIHLAAGKRLYEACLAVPEIRRDVRCPTGEARITPGFHLPCKWVIHTVGPVWAGGGYGEPEKLANCYQNCLKLANANEVRSITFPAISCGVFGYPIDLATEVAIETIRSFPGSSELEVVLVAFSTRDSERMQQTFRNLSS